MTRKRSLTVLMSIVAILFVVAAGACSDDTVPPVDSSTDGQSSDTTVDGPQADFSWPDQSQDHWPSQDTTVDQGTTDTYTGPPFGCKKDSDCFGLKCCPTPWGVKLCAPSCTP